MLKKLVKSVSSQALLIGSWLLVIGLLFLYSFTQVDLGLTLSRASIVQYLQKNFQYIGYFQRPLSTYLFCAIVSLMFISYLWTLWLVWKKKISSKTVWTIAVVSSLVLLFSYNAFSYDMFNYMFDARIVTHYHQNPYEHKALDYPADPMLGFMHWTHRTYPYGPLWLALTIPLSFIGGNFFLLTFYLFKSLAVGSYLLSAYFVQKTLKKTKLADPNFALAFFVLNPLVIVESLVSGHNDIIMLMLTLAGVYFLFDKKKYVGWIFLILSAMIKFATGILTPIFLVYPFIKHKNKDFIFFLCSIILMGVATILATNRTTFQPWYLLLPLTFSSFLSNKYYILIPSVLISFLALLQYVPYLYNGNYNPPIPDIMNQMLWWSIGVSIFATVFFVIFSKLKDGKIN